MKNVDIVASTGGVYHIENPVDVLIKSYDLAKKYLIIQSVVSIANEDPYYFEPRCRDGPGDADLIRIMSCDGS